MNIKLLISYDGKGYHGWQKSNMGPSIESVLQTILEKIFQQTIILQAASRTDAGVHAHGQVVNFFVENDSIDLNQLRYSLNQLIPNDIAVLEVVKESENFHPTLDCKEKEYHYYISHGLTVQPEHRLYSWHCYPLKNIETMKKAASYFIGTKDFSAFCNHHSLNQYDHTIREITLLSIEEIESDRLLIKVRGKNFLYRMVRNIVGTLVYVALGKISLESIPGIIESKDRKLAGITAPAHGLFLHKIFYKK